MKKHTIYICDSCNLISSDKEFMIKHELECKGVEKKKRKPKKEIDYSFIQDNFKDAFRKWCTYKRDNGGMYKTQRGIETAYNEMVEYSKNDPNTADVLVDYLISKEYKGFHDPTPQVWNKILANKKQTQNDKPIDGQISADGKKIFIANNWVDR